MSESDAIIVDVTTAQKVDHILSDHGKTLVHKIVVGDDVDKTNLKSKGWISLQDILEQENNPNCQDNLQTSSKQIMQIFFTSGTTGAPKMCAHTHGSYGYCHWVTGKYWLDLKPSDLHWNISDTGWAKSAWSNLFAPWSQGAGVFIHDMPRFEVEDVIKVLQEVPITTLCAPPTLYRSLIKSDNVKDFKSLNHCVSAGEPLNEEVIKTWHDKTGLWIREGYGQTETTLVAATFKGMDLKPGSMGKPAPGYDVKILDHDGKILPNGEEGNIALDYETSAGALFEEYVGDPEKTKKAFKNGFYLTGDRGYIDQDGYIWFTSRQDDVIISSGYRIGPFEIESALIEHPAVLESAAVGSPDPARGQIVKAFIVLANNYQNKIKGNPKEKEFLIKELQNHVKATTAPYKYPRKIEFVDELPKTVSGKIKRVELRLSEMKK